MIPRRAKLCKCGCGKEGYIWARGYLKGHEPVKPKGITKVTPKQRERIKDNKEYYERFIENHPTRCCDECGDPIPLGKYTSDGCFVSHIIAGSANEALYHDLRNAFLLCQKCEGIWSTSGTKNSRTTMKIWPEAQRRRTELLREHYEQPLMKKK